jgi:Right handed beta helix region/Chlamydia polymorphic membrane protein (Chlamydia_PMP) repeat
MRPIVVAVTLYFIALSIGSVSAESVDRRYPYDPDLDLGDAPPGASVSLFSISGTVTDEFSNPVPYVQMMLLGNNNYLSILTDQNGEYEFAGLEGDNRYTVAPTKYEYMPIIDNSIVSGTAIVALADEEIGNTDGPEPGRYHGHGSSWCSEFASWIYWVAGDPFTGGANDGGNCDEHWNMSTTYNVVAGFGRNSDWQFISIDEIDANWPGGADAALAPQPGDYVFYSNESGIDRAHSGLVDDVSGDDLLTIEGNVDNYVTPKIRYDWRTNQSGDTIVKGIGYRRLVNRTIFDPEFAWFDLNSNQTADFEMSLRRIPTTWHVPGDAATIQGGIDLAIPGDTVLVACQIFYEHDIVMKSGIYLLSETGEPSCTTIDANSLGRVFYCSGVDSTARIEGFTITGGVAVRASEAMALNRTNYGGGIECYASSPKISHCIFSGNSAQYGGGMFLMDGSAPSLTGCTFSDNESSDSGGGVECLDSSPTFTDCVFSGNNSESGAGGAVDISGLCNPEFTDCSFVNNSALLGGAIYCYYESWPSFTGCTFSGNEADDDGGGVAFAVYCDPTFTNCIFDDNSTGGEGGAIHAYYDCTPIITNCTFVNNSAALGGGIFAYYSQLILESTIIVNSTSGEAVSCDEPLSVNVNCCDVYGNAGGDWIGCIAGSAGLSGNITADPLFCDSGNGDFTISESSPCAPGNSPAECDLIGALGVNCSGQSVEDGDEITAASPRVWLGPARPNPLNPVTWISYTIPTGTDFSRITMKVYSATGRRVAMLVDAMQGPGEYQVIWDGRDHEGTEVASGIYFYGITWNGTSETRRMVLLK